MAPECVRMRLPLSSTRRQLDTHPSRAISPHPSLQHSAGGDHSGLFSPPPDKDSDDDEDDGHPVEYMRDACCVNPRTVESLYGVCVAKLNELKSFGELALQGKGLRAASIITSEEVGLMTVDKPTFDDILGSYNETQKQHKVAWFHAVQQGDTKKIRKLTNLGFSVETRLPSVEVFNRAPEFPGSHRFVDHFGTRCRRRSFVSHSLHLPPPPLCLPYSTKPQV